MNYYNEFDPQAAQWLRNLIAAGHLPAGFVDERSIEDVKPSDLRGFAQCHFFAGIGGWPLALALTGWPADRPVWTGSCPCQPFSSAGQGAGFTDERHLWPAWFHLIQQCRPAVVFGEQVASPDALRWLDLVSADLEGAGYAVGAADLCSAGVAAPHIRQRLYWVARAVGDSISARLEGLGRNGDGCRESGRVGQNAARSVAATGNACGMADALPTGRTERRSSAGIGQASGGGELGRMAEPNSTGPQQGRAAAEAPRYGSTALAEGGTDRHGRPSPHHSGWSAPDWLRCRDGKWRPVVASHVGVVDGLPDDLVHGWDSDQGRQVDGQAGETNTGTKVQGVWRADPATSKERQDRRAGGICPEGLLQPSVHEGRDAEAGLPERQPQPFQSGSDGEAILRSVRKGRAAARTPHRRGPFKQRCVELEDVVSSLPSSLALAELHGRWRDARTLRALCAAICEAGLVPFAPEQTKAVWQSISSESQDRIRMDFGRIWVARSFSPLSQGEPGRVMRLRAYGNAITPEVAARFVRAVMTVDADQRAEAYAKELPW